MLLRVSGVQVWGGASFESGFLLVRQQLAGRTRVTGSHRTPMTSQEAGKYRPGEFVGWRGVLGPTRKAWNVKIRPVKLGVMPGLHSVHSRAVTGVRNKRWGRRL